MNMLNYCKKTPELKQWLRLYIGAEEFIKGKKRWCLWLKKASPKDIKNSHILYDKVQSVKDFRLNSKPQTTNGYAKVSHLFAQITQPDDVPYLIIPSVSSERRKKEIVYNTFPWCQPTDAQKAKIDQTVQAYGFDIKTTTESTCVAELMKMYQSLV